MTIKTILQIIPLSMRRLMQNKLNFSHLQSDSLQNIVSGMILRNRQHALRLCEPMKWTLGEYHHQYIFDK